MLIFFFFPHNLAQLRVHNTRSTRVSAQFTRLQHAYLTPTPDRAYHPPLFRRPAGFWPRLRPSEIFMNGMSVQAAGPGAQHRLSNYCDYRNGCGGGPDHLYPSTSMTLHNNVFVVNARVIRPYTRVAAYRVRSCSTRYKYIYTCVYNAFEIGNSLRRSEDRARVNNLTEFHDKFPPGPPKPAAVP